MQGHIYKIKSVIGLLPVHCMCYIIFNVLLFYWFEQFNFHNENCAQIERNESKRTQNYNLLNIERLETNVYVQFAGKLALWLRAVYKPIKVF